MNAPQTLPPPADAGLTALVLLARVHGIAVEADQLRHQHAVGSQRFSKEELLRAAKGLGLKARLAPFRADRLAQVPMPTLVFDSDGRHFILAKASQDKALVQESDGSAPQIIPVADVLARSSGHLLLLASRSHISSDLARFDFSWFIPAIVKYRHLLLEVLGISLLIQLFGLVTPLMFQVVMDKVLTNRAFDTLAVVSIAMLMASLFETALTGLRNYIFSHTTNRIDVELGARLFRHLIQLPQAYFAVRRVGDSVARVRELENIRNFLTGQALTASIDLLFSTIFIAVMMMYSVKLTLIVLLSLVLYALISGGFSPLIRKALETKFSKSSDNHAFLVESVSGSETIKAHAIEPQFSKRWDQLLASYVASGFRVSNLGNLGQQLIQLVGKLVTLAILFFGAKMVIVGELSVGQLVAFNMLAQRVASPILRLAQLWQDFQQISVSMSRLGDILNTPTELPPSSHALPPIRGDIELEDLHFRYRPDSDMILQGVTLKIQAGEVIGIVGRSGSGKSTLTKLLQRLYVPEKGRARIDGMDLALANPAWLRRQVGVVLQENLLFNRSIRENIAIADPGMPLEAVIQAAQLAGAHDFICELKEGYDTIVGEHGSGLSGGQRQRIAIARALVGNPRILIFDEATSALDYETEHTLQQHMPAICHGRTVIIISHRLSTIRHADRIVSMDKGAIVEAGTHEELLSRGGLYAHLYALQTQ
ncbi:MAG: type I secretion system permease/ATPase [Curvibacter sp.]|nr:MAG: type I secretion system permease/ATPase [Curvibacter sp.]